MKKTMTWILAVAMFVSMFSMWSVMMAAEEAPVSNIYGDVNADGSVDSKDAVLLKRHLAAYAITIDMTAADVNCDTKVNTTDSVLLTRYLAQWVFESKIGQVINTEITGSVTLELASSVAVGTAVELKETHEFSKTPVKTDVVYTVNDSTVAEVNGNKLEAKKLGEITVTVMVTATFEDGETFDALDTVKIKVVSDAEMLTVSENGFANYSIVYDKKPVAAEWLSEASVYYTGASLTLTSAANAVAGGKTIIVGREGFAADLGVSVAELRDDGYVIKVFGETIAVLAKSSTGLDRGVRYLMNVCADKEAKTVKVPSDMSVAEGVGTKIKNLTIAGNPITDYVIYCPVQTAEGLLDFAEVENSAKMLRRYIYWATDYYPEIVTKVSAGQKYIYTELDQTGELGDEGYRIKIEDGIVTVTGGVKRGNLYGAFAFIEKYLGYRIFSDQQFIYEQENLDIPNGIETEFEPPFEYRCSHWKEFRETESYGVPRGNNSHDNNGYAIQNKNFGYSVGATWYHCHTFSYQLKDLPFDQNPCLTKEENMQECFESIVKLIEERKATGQEIGKELTQIWIGGNDCDHFCTCNRCRKLMAKEGGTNGGAQVHFVNRVAEQIESLYPELEVCTSAYGFTKKAPLTPYRDNVVVCYCWTGCYNNHPFNSDLCNPSSERNNMEWRKSFEEWTDKANKRYVWYYSTSFYFRMCPLPIIERLREDYRYLADQGVAGVYAEGGAGNAERVLMENLTGYLTSRVMWDPYMSEEEYEQILCEYLKVHYGSGWEAIREYIRMYHEAASQAKCFITHYDWPKNMTYIPYYGANYEKFRALFDEAIMKADNAEQVKRIELLSVSMEFLALSALHKEQYVNGTEEQKAAYEEHYRKFWQFMVDNQVALGDNVDSFTLPETFDVTKNPMHWYAKSWIPAYDLDNFEYNK